MKGRKPKTPEQRSKDGSKKRPTHADDPPEFEQGRPECPEHLSGLARGEWDRLCDRLFDAGTLTHEAMATMAGYCSMWEKHATTYALIEEHGEMLQDDKGKFYKSPAVGMHYDATRLMNSLASELGITPSSRGRVQAIKPKTDDPKKRFFKVVG
jgi:P27 family predicted phage terminase small subunit